MISAIILAAGEGQRMGPVAAGKQLLPLGESTILEKTIDHVLSSDVDETVVVLGHRAAEIHSRITAKAVRIVVNPDYRSGMSTSIIAGIKAADAAAGAFLLVLGDQPFTGKEVINRLLKEFRESGKGIIIPTWQGQRGHPLIISAKYRQELLDLKGDVGARQVLAAHARDISAVEVGSQSIVLDIDTPQEYRVLKQREHNL